MKHSLFILLFTLVGWTLASAQDFVYQPINPAFGGNVLNYGWLLNSANAQNPFSDDQEEENTLDQFTESLNQQLLNQLSRDLISDQFGEEGLTVGTYQFGDFQIDIAPGLNGLVINITDFATGGQTSITIPYL